MFSFQNLVASAFLLLSSQAAFSGQIHYTFGTPLDHVPDTVTSTQDGDSFSANLTIDSAQPGITTVFPDAQEPELLSGELTRYANLTGTISLGDDLSYTVASTSEILVGNDVEIDSYQTTEDYVIFDIDPINATLDGYDIVGIRLQFVNYVNDWGNVIDSTDLGESLDLDRFRVSQVLIWLDSPDKGSDAIYSLGVSSASEVPLPGAAWLFAPALAGLATLSARRRSRV